MEGGMPNYMGKEGREPSKYEEGEGEKTKSETIHTFERKES